MTEAIIHVSKPGQILIPENLIPKTEKDYSNIESKVWKFKNFEDEVRLIVISNILK